MSRQRTLTKAKQDARAPVPSRAQDYRRLNAAKQVNDYLLTVMDPRHHDHAPPDVCTEPLATYRSRTVFTLPVWFDATQTGKASIAVSPTMGSDSLPFVAAYDWENHNGEAVPTAFSGPGSIPRDKYYDELYSDDCQYYGIVGKSVLPRNVVPPNLGGAAVDFNNFSFPGTEYLLFNSPPDIIKDPVYFGNLPVTWIPAMFDININNNLGNWSIPVKVVNPATAPVVTEAGIQSWFNCASGVHGLTFGTLQLGNLAVNTGASTLILLEIDPRTRNVTGGTVHSTATADQVYGTFADPNVYLPINSQTNTILNASGDLENYFDWVGNYYNASQSTVLNLSCIVNFDASKYYYIGFRTTSNNTVLNSNYNNWAMTMLINNVGSDKLAGRINNGIVQNQRVIGASVQCTNMYPALYAGGNIAALSAATGILSSSYYSTSDIGNLVKFEDLASLNENENERLHTGPATKGSYTVWRPTSDRELLLRKPSEFVELDQGGIIIAVDIPSFPSNPISQWVPTFLIQIDVVYQYSTSVNYIDKYRTLSDSDAMSQIFNILTELPLSMENPTHVAKIATRALSALSPISHLPKAMKMMRENPEVYNAVSQGARRLVTEVGRYINALPGSVPGDDIGNVMRALEMLVA